MIFEYVQHVIGGRCSGVNMTTTRTCVRTQARTQMRRIYPHTQGGVAKDTQGWVAKNGCDSPGGGGDVLSPVFSSFSGGFHGSHAACFVCAILMQNWCCLRIIHKINVHGSGVLRFAKTAGHFHFAGVFRADFLLQGEGVKILKFEMFDAH